MKLEMRIGGVAAIIQALCYILGFALLATSMNPGSTEGWTQVQKLEFILQRQSLFVFWNVVIYVVFGVALVVLAVVLHRLLQPMESLAVSIGTPFGLIWAGLVLASGMVANVGLAWVSEASGSKRDRDRVPTCQWLSIIFIILTRVRLSLT